MQLARWPLILWMAALLSAAVPGIAHAQATPHIGADLFVETRAPAPGQPVRIAFRMEPERGWHGYWINPGDSGLPASVEWEAPAGVRFTQLRHPAPTLLDILGIASYVHEGPFSLLATMTVPAGLAPGTILPITAKLSWLACSDSLCVPESASLAATLQVGEGAPDAEGARIVRQAAAALPAPVPGATHARRDGQWVIDIPGPLRIDPARARLYPAGDGWFGAGAAQTIERTSGGLRVRVAPLGAAPADVFSGVISDGRSAYSIRTGTAPGGPDASGEASQAPSSATAAEPPAIAASPARAAAEAPSAMASPASAETSGLLLTAVVGAVLGGLLLNLMPCVFPILSLKALSLARSGADRAEARLEGLGYAGGSIFTATLLGGILIALKAAGQEVGWSFQLQSPAMVLILFLLTSVIALNLAGLFEFRFPAVANGSARGGWAGGFATGALAALIATPCSGPFMAGALGAALVLPAVAALAVFAGLGLGMALPFLAITWIPGLQNRMPKPGPWMAGIRRILALPMLATALALAWVLGRQTGVDGMAVGMAMAVVIGAAFWWYGHRQRIGVRAWPVLAPAVAAIGIVLAVGLPAPEPAAAAARDALHQPFSRARLAELRAAGTPVFVDFTADWCLTCKVNEKVAIETGAVQSAFREAGVVTLTGDWTRGDPEITRFLAEHGRNSIPYYLFFAPRQAGRELPQILTPALLEEMAAGGRGAREARS